MSGLATLTAVAAPADRLAELFPAHPAGRFRPRHALLAAGAVLAGAAVSLLRQPGTGALDTVWAEDGEIFLADAVNEPLPEALASSYAGYFHLGPRLLAELAALTPAGWDAAMLAVCAALVTAALAVLVYVASAAHLRSPVARTVAAAVVVVAPLAQDDIPNSIANLHWPALYALFWVLLWSPDRWPGRTAGLVTTALVVTSDILVLGLLPLAILRAAVRRDRYSAALAAVFSLGIALQLLGLFTGASSRETDLNPVRAAVGYVLRAVPGALAGHRWLGDDHTSPRWLLLAALAWLLVLAAVVVAWRRRPRLNRPMWTLAVVAAVHSVALYVLPVLLSGVAPERYAYAPAMLLVVALLALCSHRSAQLALVGLLAVVCLVNLRVPNLRADGPSWSEELDQGRATCAEQVATGARLRLPPADNSWYAELPCDYVRR
jgi:hypothetical protein